MRETDMIAGKNAEREAPATPGPIAAGQDARRGCGSNGLIAMLGAAREFSNLIAKEGDPQALLQRVCNELVESRGYDNAWTLWFDERETLRRVVGAGLGGRTSEAVARLRQGPLPACVQDVLRRSDIVVTHHPTEACNDCPLWSSRQDGACLSIAMEHEGKTQGLLICRLPSALAEDGRERATLQATARNVAFVLHAVELQKMSRGTAADLIRFRAAMDTSAEAIFLIDRSSMQFIDTNATACLSTGYTRGELLRMGPHDLKPLWTKEALARQFDKVISGGQETGVIETVMRRKDGSDFPVEVLLRSLEADGRIILIAMSHDITERRRVEKALAESEQKYRTLFEDSLEAISVTKGGRIVDVNPQWLRLHGFEHESQVIGMDVINFIHPDDRRILDGRRRMPAKDRARRYEIRDIRKDGSSVEVEVYSTGISLGGENAILTTIRDIGERKQLQEELIQSAKLAAVGTMISGIAHEINNPLAAISGYAHLLATDETTPESVRQDIRHIIAQTERCTHIVENLLRFARREKAEKAATDLNEVLANTVNLRRYEMRVTDVEVTEEYDPGLPETCVNAHRLQQVFLNIISNAYDAIKDRKGKGRIVVRTKHRQDEITVEIEDNGGGIKHLDRIFEPFFTTKEVGKGTGLGLSVAYGIVQEHDGIITAENVGDGARFTIHLPVRAEEIEKGARPGQEDAPASPPAGGKRVLVVDDEKDVADAVRRILTRLGYKVDMVATPEEAVTRLKADPFDVLISDLIMPGKMTARDLYHWVQNNVPKLDSRLIFMTGSTTGERTEEILAGIDCPVIRKPFSIDGFCRLVNGVAGSA